MDKIFEKLNYYCIFPCVYFFLIYARSMICGSIASAENTGEIWSGIENLGSPVGRTALLGDV